MAKLKTLTRWLENGTKLTVDVKISTDGAFSMPVPDMFHALTGELQFVGSTLKEVENKLDALIDKYHATHVAETKVIFYKFNTTAYIMRNDVVVYSENEIHFAEGTLLGLDWFICKQMDCGERTTYTRLHDDGREGITFHWNEDSSFKKLEWTPQREAFFKYFQTKLEDLILGIDKFLDDKKLIEKIDSGVLLLKEGER